MVTCAPIRCVFLLVLVALAACAGPSRPITEIDFETAFPLDDAERELSPDEVLAAARRLLADRESPGALDHAVSLMHYHRPLDAGSVELDVLLAEAHCRIADACDLGEKAGTAQHRQHRQAGLICAGDGVRQAPDFGPAHYWLGRLLLCAAEGEKSYGRLKGALQALEAADRLAPDCDDAGPARYLGRIYQETPGWPLLGSISKAVAYYERAAKIAPDNLQTRLWLGEAYAAGRQREKARAEWERAIAAPRRAGREKEDQGLQVYARERLDKLGGK
jgi:tetratricopeptide (TPR) repeat protein